MSDLPIAQKIIGAQTQIDTTDSHTLTRAQHASRNKVWGRKDCFHVGCSTVIERPPTAPSKTYSLNIIAILISLLNC